MEPVVLDEVTSTNDVARELAGSGCPEGTVVLAARQSRGRGRLGRHWASDQGGLWFSLVFRPAPEHGVVSRLSLVSAVGSAEGVTETTQLRVGLKWPNDLYMKGKKVAGILHELGRDWVVAGIGINVNQLSWDGEMAVPPTSLRLETGRRQALEPLLAAVVRRTFVRYRQALSGDWALVRDAWRELSITLGHVVLVSMPGQCFEGEALDIDEDGNLLVKTGDEVVTVMAGDVTLARRKAGWQCRDA